MLPTLSAFIDVANIPKKYGGELDFECGMQPVLDPAILNALNLNSPQDKSTSSLFLTAPVRWIDGENGDLIALGVGSEHGKERREPVAVLHAEVAKHAFPGMSRQNTQNMYPGISRQTTQHLMKTTSRDDSAEQPPRPLTNGSSFLQLAPGGTPQVFGSLPVENAKTEVTSAPIATAQQL